MEFKLINPKEESGFIQAIEFNFEELKEQLSKNLEKFKNIVYSDDSIKDAKTDKANLNKFREAIENERKRVKNLCLKPYNDFEAKIKVITQLIDEPILVIDTRVKSYEQKNKDAKKEEIEKYYLAIIGDLIDLLPLDKIFNDKWLNLTTSIKNVEKEILLIIEKAKFDLQTIKDLKSEWELTLIDTYLSTLDISAALREKTRLEERKAALEAMEQKTTIVNEQAPATGTLEDFKEDDKVVFEEKIYLRKFWVEGTKEQLTGLREYMAKTGIKYGGIE